MEQASEDRKVIGQLYDPNMEKTTSKKLARAQILERQAAAAAERKARERQNAENLTEFVVATAKAEEVDVWLAERIEKANRDAEKRRRAHIAAAGKALQAMRFRGETLSGIAAQAGVTTAKVREYLKAAAADGATQTAEAVVSEPEDGSQSMPTEIENTSDGAEPASLTLVAQ
ncbi:hypothetical protein [Mycolicibacterium peregrinum]|nr:hypothetical protein [Mycolicibacterium peregrinum]